MSFFLYNLYLVMMLGLCKWLFGVGAGMGATLNLRAGASSGVDLADQAEVRLQL